MSFLKLVRLENHAEKSAVLIELDRDENASTNILKEGLKIISAGTVDYKGGETK